MDSSWRVFAIWLAIVAGAWLLVSSIGCVDLGDDDQEELGESPGYDLGPRTVAPDAGPEDE